MSKWEPSISKMLMIRTLQPFLERTSKIWPFLSFSSQWAPRLEPNSTKWIRLSRPPLVAIPSRDMKTSWTSLNIRDLNFLSNYNPQIARTPKRWEKPSIITKCIKKLRMEIKRRIVMTILWEQQKLKCTEFLGWFNLLYRALEISFCILWMEYTFE